MRKIFAACLAMLFAASANATTPATVLAGSIVNSWNQAGLRVTQNLFDLAVSGRGFFVLQTPDGRSVFTREGAMSMDVNGYLVHKSSGYRVVGKCGDKTQELRLSDFTQSVEGGVLKSFKVDLDGTIQAYYDSGHMHKTCTVSLAIFQNPNYLKRSGHILTATTLSGDAYISTPQHEGRGSVYGAAQEELDEAMYQMNLR